MEGKLRCGLIGGNLSHSFSPEIHRALGEYEYCLYALAPEELEPFLRREDWDGLNVTIPYKRAVMPFCAELSEAAKRIGCVNTLLLRPGGTIWGDNTDLYGLSYLAARTGISFAGKKALVLGSGGTGLTARAAAQDGGAREVVMVSRNGPVTYETAAAKHRDAQILINATPVGMYPNNDEIPLNLAGFSGFEGVLDVVYNPLRTHLVLAAQSGKIPASGGLPMLVAQAARASALFTGKPVSDAAIEWILGNLYRKRANIVLIGMPGCGKTALGQQVAGALGREHWDMDEWIQAKAGESTEEIIRSRGEAAFREIEAEAVRELGRRTGIVLSTGGGVVTRAENRAGLKQNGMVFFVQRPLDRLCAQGRPLSMGGEALAALYRERFPLYQAWADHSVDNGGSLEAAAQTIVEVFYEAACD